MCSSDLATIFGQTLDSSQKSWRRTARSVAPIQRASPFRLQRGERESEFLRRRPCKSPLSSGSFLLNARCQLTSAVPSFATAKRTILRLLREAIARAPVSPVQCGGSARWKRHPRRGTREGLLARYWRKLGSKRLESRSRGGQIPDRQRAFDAFLTPKKDIRAIATRPGDRYRTVPDSERMYGPAIASFGTHCHIRFDSFSFTHSFFYDLTATTRPYELYSKQR